MGPVEDAVSGLLAALGVDLRDANFAETPRRVAEHLAYHCAALDSTDEDIVATYGRAVFPDDYGGMVTVTSVEAHGLCPHHLLPVTYTADLAYLPQGYVIGVSKLGRLAQTLAVAPQLQETVCTRIATALRDLVATDNVAVVLRAKHACMWSRGITDEHARVTTAEMWGAFRNDRDGTKTEFMHHLERNGVG